MRVLTAEQAARRKVEAAASEARAKDAREQERKALLEREAAHAKVMARYERANAEPVEGEPLGPPARGVSTPRQAGGRAWRESLAPCGAAGPARRINPHTGLYQPDKPKPARKAPTLTLAQRVRAARAEEGLD